MNHNPQRTSVILDTDPGIDDAMALYLLLRSPAIDLRAITTVYGNAAVATTTRNACLLRQLFGAATPIARGASHPLLPREQVDYPVQVHGADGLSGMAGSGDVDERLDPRPAHELICDMVNAEPGRISLLAIGPLTNLALALRHDPGIAKKVAQVVVMGGAFGTHGHFGNVTPVAEANIFNDPEAADLVFTAAWRVVVVGLDVTQQVVMSEDFLRRLRQQDAPASDFLWGITRGYQRFYQARDGIAGIYSHDASAAAFLIAPDAFELRSGPVRVATEGIARGQTIQAFKDLAAGAQSAWTCAPPQQVCVDIEAGRVLALFEPNPPVSVASADSAARS